MKISELILLDDVVKNGLKSRTYSNEAAIELRELWDNLEVEIKSK